jgi:catechol 2,3-dioxygenase-like lactoylglutathione lyase family enzyme
MKIREFAFIIYPSTDRERSRAFYEGVLGLTPTMSMDLPDGFWIEYEIGPHTLAVGKEHFLQPSANGPHVALEVEDFDATIEHLRQQEVRFAVEPMEMPKCRAAVVEDPDGNKLGIHSRKR